MPVDPTTCPHDDWTFDKGTSGLQVAICRRCGERTIPAATKFSALSYVDPNKLHELALDDPERYRKLVEKADGYQAEAVRKARARMAREDARRQVPPSNGKRPSGNGSA